MVHLTELPEELLIQIVSCLGFNDIIKLRVVNKIMNEMVSMEIDNIFEREERARQYRLLKEEHNKSGFRSVESAINDEAFEKGVKDGYTKYCNSSFIEGQWNGYQLLCYFVFCCYNKQLDLHDNHTNYTVRKRYLEHLINNNCQS